MKRILDEDCSGLNAVYYLVWDCAAQVTPDHNWVPDSQFDALRTHFNGTQIVELTFCIASCTFYYKFNDVMQLNMKEEPSIFHQPHPNWSSCLFWKSGK